MGLYIQRSDLEQSFGVENIRIWGDLSDAYNGQLPATDPINIAAEVMIQARIDYMIARAEDEVTDRFRQSAYLIPFQPYNGTLNFFFGIISQMAGVALFESRGLRNKGDTSDRMKALYDKAIADLDAILAGERHIAAARRPIGGVEVPRVAGGIRFPYSVARGEGSQPWGLMGPGSADGQRSGPNQGSWQ